MNSCIYRKFETLHIVLKFDRFFIFPSDFLNGIILHNNPYPKRSVGCGISRYRASRNIMLPLNGCDKGIYDLDFHTLSLSVLTGDDRGHLSRNSSETCYTWNFVPPVKTIPPKLTSTKAVGINLRHRIPTTTVVGTPSHLVPWQKAWRYQSEAR